MPAPPARRRRPRSTVPPRGPPPRRRRESPVLRRSGRRRSTGLGHLPGSPCGSPETASRSGRPGESRSHLEEDPAAGVAGEFDVDPRRFLPERTMHGGQPPRPRIVALQVASCHLAAIQSRGKTLVAAGRRRPFPIEAVEEGHAGPPPPSPGAGRRPPPAARPDPRGSAATTRARDSANAPGSRTARERSWPALEVAWVSSVGEPERTMTGWPARDGGGAVTPVASEAASHQVSGTRNPTAAARRRLSSFGTDESLNRARGCHGTSQLLRPSGGIVDHRIVAPRGKRPHRPSLPESQSLAGPGQLLQGDHPVLASHQISMPSSASAERRDPAPGSAAAWE